jgi:hypothetical protein
MMDPPKSIYISYTIGRVVLAIKFQMCRHPRTSTLGIQYFYIVLTYFLLEYPNLTHILFLFRFVILKLM